MPLDTARIIFRSSVTSDDLRALDETGGLYWNSVFNAVTDASLFDFVKRYHRGKMLCLRCFASLSLTCNYDLHIATPKCKNQIEVIKSARRQLPPDTVQAIHIFAAGQVGWGWDAADALELVPFKTKLEQYEAGLRSRKPKPDEEDQLSRTNVRTSHECTRGIKIQLIRSDGPFLGPYMSRGPGDEFVEHRRKSLEEVGERSAEALRILRSWRARLADDARRRWQEPPRLEDSRLVQTSRSSVDGSLLIKKTNKNPGGTSVGSFDQTRTPNAPLLQPSPVRTVYLNAAPSLVSHSGSSTPFDHSRASTPSAYSAPSPLNHPWSYERTH